MFHLNSSNNLPVGFLTSTHDPLLSGLHRHRSFMSVLKDFQWFSLSFMEINKKYKFLTHLIRSPLSAPYSQINFLSDATFNLSLFLIQLLWLCPYCSWFMPSDLLLQGFLYLLSLPETFLLWKIAWFRPSFYSCLCSMPFFLEALSDKYI